VTAKPYKNFTRRNTMKEIAKIAIIAAVVVYAMKKVPFLASL
jgi:hypothetical protein